VFGRLEVGAALVNGPNRRKQAILTETEIARVSDAATELLRSNLGDHPLFSRTEVERTVRMIPLGARCVEARERAGLGVKDVARQLGVPQYRVRAIESGSPGQIDSEVLQKYIVVLGLERWYAEWRAANGALFPELKRTLAKEPRRGRTRG
jgi:hypothetical protein